MSPQDEEQELQNRKDKAEEEIRTNLEKIFRKGDKLTAQDKAYLKARRTYLSKADAEAYKDVLNEKVAPIKDTEDEKKLEEMERKDLEKMAKQIGIEDADDKKAYKTNKALQDAIKAKQEELAKEK